MSKFERITMPDGKCIELTRDDSGKLLSAKYVKPGDNSKLKEGIQVKASKKAGGEVVSKNNKKTDKKALAKEMLMLPSGNYLEITRDDINRIQAQKYVESEANLKLRKKIKAKSSKNSKQKVEATKAHKKADKKVEGTKADKKVNKEVVPKNIEKNPLNDSCLLVEASKLSLADKFMQYTPKTKKAKEFKRDVEKVIETGVRDFWRPIYDPSFDDDGHICYKPGKRLAVDRSYNWWRENAKKYAPERGSRLGTKSEYVAFMATLIKGLIAIGWSEFDAWDAVCEDSKKLGNYWTSSYSKRKFETTGHREVCGWYDLANSEKMLAEDEEAGGFWLAGGMYSSYGSFISLTTLYHVGDLSDEPFSYCGGWLVFTKGSTDH